MDASRIQYEKESPERVKYMIQDNRVLTPCGMVQGENGKSEDTVAFKGIRYANAKRFAYPEIVTSWENVYDATSFGACAYQPRAFYDEAKVKEKAFYYEEFRKGESYVYSDDCLFLNIWAPKTAENAPVLFYIHGGGFRGGCGHEKHFSGEAYAKEGVILITCNYRLGPMGFLSHPAFAKEAGHTGNYGLYDQQCAMQWVQNNIKAFGGNPNNVTIMGQSAGAMSVQQHCVSPLAKGLFHKAIMLSGGGVSKMMSPCAVEKAYPFYEALAQRLGCAVNTAEALRKVNAEKLFAAYGNLCKEYKGGMKFSSPMLDGRILNQSPQQAAKEGAQKNIPYLTCSTSEDMMPPIIFKMAKAWSALQAKQGKCPSYTAFFSRQLPGDDKGAWHSADLWYAFGTLSNGWRPFTSWDRQLSETIVKYYANFAKTGNPNGQDLPHWQPASKTQSKVMCFGDNAAEMSKVSMRKLIHTMLTKPNVGE